MIDSHIHLSCKCYNQTFPYIDYDGKELTIVADGRRETVIATPIEYLLLETDGPYVKPERPDDVTGKKWAKARNTSLILPNIAEKIAELKGMMVKDVVRITEENTRRVFKLNNCASYSRYF